GRDARPGHRPDASPGPGPDADDAGWRPEERARPARALSASGLEDFSRGAIANAIEHDADAPAGPRGAIANAIEHDADAPAGPRGASERDTRDQAMIMPVGEQRAEAGRRDKKSDTMPMPGGFGSSGT